MIKLFRWGEHPIEALFNEFKDMLPEANDATVTVEFLAEVISKLPVSAQIKKDLPALFQQAIVKEEKDELISSEFRKRA